MTDERRKINYTVVCVGEFAKRQNISQKQAFQYLDQYKGIEFLKEHYDIEHTLSLDDALNDITLICEQNGGVLA